MAANSVRINTLALGAHLPTMFATRSPFVDGGGLMSYGANNVELFRRAGDYVDKILRPRVLCWRSPIALIGRAL
jgi:hypothetical protein